MYHVSLDFQCIQYMDAVMKKLKMGMGEIGVRFLEEGKEWRLPGILYTDDLVLCGDPEEVLKAMLLHYVEIFRRRRLKVNVGKSKVMVVKRRDWSERLLWIRFEYVRIQILGVCFG